MRTVEVTDEANLGRRHFSTTAKGYGEVIQPANERLENALATSGVERIRNFLDFHQKAHEGSIEIPLLAAELGTTVSQLTEHLASEPRFGHIIDRRSFAAASDRSEPPSLRLTELLSPIEGSNPQPTSLYCALRDRYSGVPEVRRPHGSVPAEARAAVDRPSH